MSSRITRRLVLALPAIIGVLRSPHLDRDRPWEAKPGLRWPAPHFSGPSALSDWLSQTVAYHH